MKKILCILLCAGMLMPLAACGGEKEKTNDQNAQDLKNDADFGIGKNDKEGSGITGENEDDVPVVLDERYEVVCVTIAKNEDGKQAIVKVDDQSKKDYFFAIDEQGNCYRVEYYSSLYSEVVKQGATIYLSYASEWCTELENAEVDHGFTPQYHVDGNIWSVEAWKLKDVACEQASTVFEVPARSLRLTRSFYVNGKYEFSFAVYMAGVSIASPSLTLDAAGNNIGKYLGHDGELMRYIGTDIEKAIPAAKAKIQAECGMEDPGFYFDIDEDDGYVYLCAEVIVHLSPDHPDYGKGCGDHRHDFYREKLGKA